MRMIQTFWTAGQDPLKYAFGWTQPEYNLMSWALSCCSLREHYDDVELYTDSAGYHILIEELKLPYTKVHVIFDNFDCLSQHWALAKIKTYSLQTEPFIHVDGDVYLSKPIPREVEEVSLVVQNKERSTDYYKNMVERILNVKTLYIDNKVLSQIKKGIIPSYNMGIFGGRDLDFIHEYCNKVFEFIDVNQMNDVNNVNSSVCCNIFFEQIYLAIYSKLMNKPIVSLIPNLIDDNGYMYNDFCNLKDYEISSYFHILGGHKRKKSIMSLLKNILLLKDESVYKRIISLFFEKKRHASEKTLSIERSIAQYDDFKEKCFVRWNEIGLNNIINMEISIATYLMCKENSCIEKKDIKIRPNSYLEVFSVFDNWHLNAINMLKMKYRCEPFFPLKKIAMIPSTNGAGIIEFPLTDFECDVISCLKENGAMTINQILCCLAQKYKLSERYVSGSFFINALKQLLDKGVIIMAK